MAGAERGGWRVKEKRYVIKERLEVVGRVVGGGWGAVGAGW